MINVAHDLSSLCFMELNQLFRRGLPDLCRGMRYDPNGGPNDAEDEDDSVTVATNTSASTQTTGHASNHAANHRSILQVPSLASEGHRSDDDRSSRTNEQPMSSVTVHPYSKVSDLPSESFHGNGRRPGMVRTSARGMPHSARFRPGSSRSSSPVWSMSQSHAGRGTWHFAESFPHGMARGPIPPMSQPMFSSSESISNYIPPTLITASSTLVTGTPPNAADMGRRSPQASYISSKSVVTSLSPAARVRSGRGASRIPLSSRGGGGGGVGVTTVTRSSITAHNNHLVVPTDSRNIHDTVPRRPTYSVSSRGGRVSAMVRRGSTPPQVSSPPSSELSMSSTTLSPYTSSLSNLSIQGKDEVPTPMERLGFTLSSGQGEENKASRNNFSTIVPNPPDGISINHKTREMVMSIPLESPSDLIRVEEKSAKEKAADDDMSDNQTSLPLRRARSHAFRPLFKKRKLIFSSKDPTLIATSIMPDAATSNTTTTISSMSNKLVGILTSEPTVADS
jgi:hypothetical protein